MIDVSFLKKTMSEMNIRSNIIAQVESEVVKVLNKRDYTLNTVNIYGENLLHTSAANWCTKIVNKILSDFKDHSVINRKSKFGWTPLMHAIRNKDINTVKLLLSSGCDINETTYLGLSVISFAAAVSEQMFEVVNDFCPKALLNASNDDINPLCIAAMKNDRKLFFRLLGLGLNISNANDYTHFMMKQSVIPEISSLAKGNFDMEDYWNDERGNIKTEDNSSSGIKLISKDTNKLQNMHNDVSKTSICLNTPIIMINECKMDTEQENNNDSTFPDSNVLNVIKNYEICDLISPTFTYISNEEYPASPNMYFNLEKKSTKPEVFFPETPKKQSAEQTKDSYEFFINKENDHDVTIDYINELSPERTPNTTEVEEYILGENTPTPPHCKTPPRGMILSHNQAEMIFLLKHFNLTRHIPLFLEQEVDMDIFLILTNNDLMEIGIQSESDRQEILAAINEYKIHNL